MTRAERIEAALRLLVDAAVVAEHPTRFVCPPAFKRGIRAGRAAFALPPETEEREAGWATCEECSQIVPMDEVAHVCSGDGVQLDRPCRHGCDHTRRDPDSDARGCHCEGACDRPQCHGTGRAPGKEG